MGNHITYHFKDGHKDTIRTACLAHFRSPMTFSQSIYFCQHRNPYKYGIDSNEIEKFPNAIHNVEKCVYRVSLDGFPHDPRNSYSSVSFKEGEQKEAVKAWIKVIKESTLGEFLVFDDKEDAVAFEFTPMTKGATALFAVSILRYIEEYVTSLVTWHKDKRFADLSADEHLVAFSALFPGSGHGVFYPQEYLHGIFKEPERLSEFIREIMTVDGNFWMPLWRTKNKGGVLFSASSFQEEALKDRGSKSIGHKYVDHTDHILNYLKGV